ncbi:hypothetical protein [Peptoniphilus catoniae]|uniref:hypothetical protein n=1 Tax=Peptoniphilus catoniae TaxID=1660341 RepID=UPI0010FE12BC|nr:hypothetical protein [Peptoniphilus catoniae]
MSIDEIKATTLADFEVMLKAYSLNQIDKRYIASFIAWQSALARSNDKKGKPVYRKFKDLFDYEKELKQVEDKKIEISEKEINIYNKISEMNGGE